MTSREPAPGAGCGAMSGYAREVVHETLPNGKPAYVARVLAMPGLLAQEDTAEAALASLDRVAGRYMEILVERGVRIPAPDLPDWIGSLTVYWSSDGRIRLENLRVTYGEPQP